MTIGGDFLYRHETVREILYKSAERFGDRCAFTFLDSEGKKCEISYKQFKSDVVSLALAIVREKGEKNKAAIVSCNCSEWCVSYLACLSA